jgi:protein phosphatase
VVVVLPPVQRIAGWVSIFPRHEVIDPTEVQKDLIGDAPPHWSLSDLIFAEVQRRMAIKLRIGQRVVIVGESLDRGQRARLTSAAAQVGVPIFYVTDGGTDTEASRGDGVADVIDLRLHDVHAVQPLPEDPLEAIQSNWSGITVVGDVHGMYQSLLDVIKWARDRNHFMLFLGDILDYGASTLEVGDEVYRLVMRGEAELVVGNHERKIMRWADGQRVRLSNGNRVTTNALSALGDTAKSRWLGRFRGLYSRSRLFRQIGDVIFVHGAAHSALWDEGQIDRTVENAAFFGEIDDHLSKPDQPVRSYRWVDSIPAGKTVMVGHDIRSMMSPYVCTNENGGRAVFLDTGSGKGGHLSTADFRFTENGLHHLNYNMH